MKYVTPYLSESENLDILDFINESLAPAENMISRALSLGAIKEECNFLNRIESMIPEDLQLQLHLNMILDESKKSLARYNRNLIKRRNLVIESAIKSLPISESANIKESIDLLLEELKSSIKSRSISEENISTMPVDVSSVSTEYGNDFDNVMKNISSPDDIPADMLKGEQGSVMSIVKMLWNGLTEGGSPIGIFQFILDIVGLVGDFFGPVGLIADVINGIIYLYREKYMLALISFIAAMIPFGGNVLKGWLQTSKIAKPVMDIGGIYLKDGSKVGAKVTDDAAKVIAKSAPESLKALDYIAKTAKEAVGGVSGFIAKFFDKFLGKLVGWIPFIGKPLKAFFEGVAGAISSFGSRVGKFADDIPQAMTKAEVDTMNTFFKEAGKEGSEITLKGSDLIVTSSKGGSVTIPANMLRGTDFMLQRYGKGAGKKMQKALKNAGMNSADFYKSLNNGLRSMDGVYGKTAKIGAATISFGKKVPLFIGKEVYKFISDFKPSDLLLSDQEYEAWGNAAIYDLMQDRTKKAMEENPNALYSVPYVDALKDNEATKVLRKTQNDYAEAFDLPNVGVVGWYARGEKDKRPEEVTKFYNDLYEGNTQALDQMIEDFPAFESSGSNLRYVKPFSQFI
jgi:hypothetical protein